MTSTGGYNPLRWICKERNKCWNLEHRFNIEYFEPYLPRKIAMTDIDATVEVKGNFLFLEFKSPGAPFPLGQQIYFQKLTELSPRISACIVEAVCRTSQVNAIKKIWKGKIGEWEPCDLDGLCAMVGGWADFADGIKREQPHDIQLAR